MQIVIFLSDTCYIRGLRNFCFYFYLMILWNTLWDNEDRSGTSPGVIGPTFWSNKKETKFRKKKNRGSLKSVNSNFTLAVHSRKFGQAKTHFLSHVGEKKEKKYD